MTKYLVIFCLCGFAGECLAQDYIITDSTYQQGKVTRHGKDQVAFRKQGLEGYKMYPLRDIKEFKQGNTVYEAIVVNGERKLYERLAAGNTNLYLDEKAFILKKGNDVVPLDKNNFRTKLRSVITCDKPGQSFWNITYSTASLKQLVKQSNNGACSIGAIPYRRLGFYAGYNTLKFEVSDFESTISQTASAPSLGIFYDAPSYKSPWLFLSADLSWMMAKPIFYTASGRKTSYLDLNVNQVVAQFSFKVVMGKGRVSPYLRLGGFGSFANVKSPNGGLITTEQYASSAEITRLPIDGTGKGFFGLQTGGGFEIQINERKKLHLEARYLKSASTKIEPLEIKYSSLCFILGINI